MSGLHYKLILPVFKNYMYSILSNSTCQILNFIFLYNNGSFFSFTNQMAHVQTSRVKHHCFQCEYTNSGDKTQFQNIIDKIKRVDIFAHKKDQPLQKTIIHKTQDYVSKDEVISITMEMCEPYLFTTTFIKVSILEESETHFIMCLNTCKENIVNGYYRVIVRYEPEGAINIQYSKIQQFSNCALGMIFKANEAKYVNSNIESVMNTMNHFFEFDKVTKENVKYTYE